MVASTVARGRRLPMESAIITRVTAAVAAAAMTTTTMTKR
jgi:hypothetical protein